MSSARVKPTIRIMIDMMQLPNWWTAERRKKHPVAVQSADITALANGRQFMQSIRYA
jgi:hypothetical protein